MKQLKSDKLPSNSRSSSEDEDSDSCSQQSSSDTNKESKAPQFSVLRSDSDGLRMKISAIRNVKNDVNSQIVGSSNNNNLNNNKKNNHSFSVKKRKKRKISTATSSSCCSICSRSESDASSEPHSNSGKVKKLKVKRKRVIGASDENKPANISTDSDCESRKKKKDVANSSSISNNLPSKSGIAQCDALPGSSISSSDNELPALVNAAIKCVESGSDTENQSVEPTKQYTSTLLRDFMVKTQMLGNTSNTEDKNEDKSGSCHQSSANESQTRKKRGRPKKIVSVVQKEVKEKITESADSGIISTAQSSSPSPNNHNKKISSNKVNSAKSTNGPVAQQKEISTQKLNVASLDKHMYATERVLYPPKGKKKNNAKACTKLKTSKEDLLDPLWKKIDVNSKFRRPSLSGYKSDGGNTVCSKILAARSGYVSDYSLGNRGYSGYRSDVSGRSRYSMRSCVSRAKSCDFRCGYSKSKNRKFRRKRRSIIKHSKSLGNVNEQDILLLAGLSLGQSSEASSRESICKPVLTNSNSKKYGEINRFIRTGEYFGRNKKMNTAGKIENLNDNATENILLSGNKTEISFRSDNQSVYQFEDLSKKIHSRRSSVVSRCSSFSAYSKFDKRKRRRRPRIKYPRNNHVDSKLNTEIEILTNSFSSLCNINTDKSLVYKDKEKCEKDKQSNQRNTGKRNIKKRKPSESAEHHTVNTMFKRRHKKAGQSSPDEHKLPLKKRHYLLAPGEKSDGKGHLVDGKSKEVNVETKPPVGKNSSNSNSKLTSKAITPKKRHLLESSHTNSAEEGSNLNSKPILPSGLSDSKPVVKVLETGTESPSRLTGQVKSDKDITKKKNRLEGLVTKIQTVNHSLSKDTIAAPPNPRPNAPPPGIFEPSVELEIQIPTKINSSSVIMKSEVDSPNSTDFIDFEKSLSEPKYEKVVETLLTKTGGNMLLKRKRRKTFNRTGFPSVKRKKRKITNEWSDSACETKSTNLTNINATENEAPQCDRVPRLGEASDSFLQRHRQPRLTVVSLEKLQDPVKKVIAGDNVDKKQKTAESEAVTANEVENKNMIVDEQEQSSETLLVIPVIPKRKIRGRRKGFSKVKIERLTECSNSSTSTVTKPDQLDEFETERAKKCSVMIPIKKNLELKLYNENLNGIGIVENSKVIKKDVQKPAETDNKKKQNKKETIGDSLLSEVLEQEPLPMNEESDSSMEYDSNENAIKSKKLSKLKKSFVTAGLFSDFFKSKKLKKLNVNRWKKPELENNKGRSSLLPPPPYCEKFFRRTIREFNLPYDVWWAYTNSKLPSRITVPSWNYKKIRTNVYGDVRPNPAIDHQACNCKAQAACGDDCLNRLVYTECSPSNCPCSDKCQNQKIQKHDIAPGIERFMTENKGWGVRTNLPIRKGTYILEYVGEVVTEKEFKERMASLYINDTHHYCLNLDGGLVIDGHRMGSDGRFVNHSCSPNCEMQKWSVNGLFRMALFASRYIQSGEELTYDYNFSLFNPSEGQPCRCDTPQCRGVIGGKSQRVKPLEKKAIEPPPSVRGARMRKRQAKKNSGRLLSRDIVVSQCQYPSDRERRIIKTKKCFLMRNLEKVRRLKTKSGTKNSETSSRPSTPSSIAAQISALRVPRNIKTRGLALAAHDPEVEKIAKMAVILREICLAFENFKDSDGKSQIAKLHLPSKRKRSALDRNFIYVDFPTVQANVEKGLYKEPDAFNEDITRILTNSLFHFGAQSEEATIISELSKIYQQKKQEVYSRLLELVHEKNLKGFRSSSSSKQLTKTAEDVIQCICGLFKDEGLMIQCSKCLVWQHTECTKANVKAENYLCEKCESREVDLEIPLEEFTEEGYRYYLSLLRGTLQIRQGDTVYVLRDIPIKDENGKVYATKKHTYETIGKIDYSECDIFRIERLWKNNEGKRFIFGHHYLRPHETFHEPTRKFYENEVVRVPLYEIVPIELVIGRCWVLDRTTFCKGRPVDCTLEKHVYICELRVDKTARFFSKAKTSYPTCTKNYAFRKFKEPLKISRTYAPHDVDPALVKPKKRKNEEVPIVLHKKISSPVIQLLPPPPKTINEKRTRLECILKVLLRKQGMLLNGKPVDLSYLLTGRGARQRRANAANVPT